jgi:xylose isomerase
MTRDPFEPQASDKFTFGLWTVGNPGADPFGRAVREKLTPVQIVQLLAEVGAYGVNLHDEDLVPIDASPRARDAIVAEFKRALADHGLVVPMATTNLFSDPVFRDGAFTASDPRVRAYARSKTMRAIDLGVELGAHTYVFWGGREGVETDACRDPRDALAWLREALDYLCAYCKDQGYRLRFALEAKPNEPRSDIYLPTTGAMLGFIATLAHPEMVGVNPEVAHEHMAGLNMCHAVAQAWDAGKLFHIDLNDQNYARYDQDLRFGSQNPKAAFILVRFLENVGYDGPRHFDAHAYRTEDSAGVKAFARGCMRSYLLLKHKAKQLDGKREFQDLLAVVRARRDASCDLLGPYDRGQAAALKAFPFDRSALAAPGLAYERLDQIVFDTLLGG